MRFQEDAVNAARQAAFLMDESEVQAARAYEKKMASLAALLGCSGKEAEAVYVRSQLPLDGAIEFASRGWLTSSSTVRED
jgi:hypothetical protein